MAKAKSERRWEKGRRDSRKEGGRKQFKVSSVHANCPIKLKVCHPLCYWYRKGRCTFPPEGYDKRGNPRGRKNRAIWQAKLLASVRAQNNELTGFIEDQSIRRCPRRLK